MATTTNLDDFLSSLGFDANEKYNIPENPADAALAGVNAFVREHAADSPDSSTGIIHISGPSIIGNAAPVKAVGNLLTDIQGVIDAIGASIMGNRTTGGAIPGAITGRTEMSMIASPMPGSVVIQIAPSLARTADLYPNGPSLFDIEEETGARPLADQAFTEFSALVNELSVDAPDENDLVDHLTDLGPRVATAMKTFCETIDKGVFDIELEWEEPNRSPSSTAISHSHAKRAAAIIATAKIENEEVTLEGALLTITQSIKDKLRLLADDNTEIVISIGDISPAAIYPLRTGDRVRVLAERRISTKPGGKRNVKLVGKALEAIQKIDF